MEFIKSNKKLIIIIGIILVAIVTIILIFIFKNSDTNLSLEKRLERIGESFYKEHYYKEVDKGYKEDKEKIQHLKNYENTGIKIALDELRRYTYTNIDINKELEYFTEKECDIVKTSITIYPEDPYNESSFRIISSLNCEKTEE